MSESKYCRDLEKAADDLVASADLLARSYELYENDELNILELDFLARIKLYEKARANADK